MVMSEIFVGIDPSWTGLAVVGVQALTAARPECVFRKVYATKPEKFASHMARLDYLGLCVTTAFGIMTSQGSKVTLTAIEGYSHASAHGAALAGELGGHLRWLLWHNGVAQVDVPPASLKKFVTGKGNADKSLMLREVYRRWSFEAVDDNEADAFTLAVAAMTVRHGSAAPVTATQVQALNGAALKQVQPRS
jgi:Holliday junction resolvasome RuvABC endonuclease subunit